MVQSPAGIPGILTESSQVPRHKSARRPAKTSSRGRSRTSAKKPALSGDSRPAARGGGDAIEMDFGITVYPPRDGKGPWRAVWVEDGRRRGCESVSKEKLAGKLEKVKERLAVGACSTERPGADLIAWYLDPDRLPARKQWSRKHAHTQRRLCERFIAPVIGEVVCADITIRHMQDIVNAAPTAGEGDRLHRALSALVAAGIRGGYLVNPRLADVHWQAGGRELPAPKATVAGESGQWVDPAEIPSDDDVHGLGRAMTGRPHGELYELMVNTAAYAGLRWGELSALTVDQVNTARREITMNCQAIEVAGHLYIETPKNRKFRATVYPRLTPRGYPLAEKIAARAKEARAEREAGTNPLGLVFPTPTGKYWRNKNFNSRILKPAYRKAGWRDEDGNGRWVWHSLRHVFCTVALFTWKLEATDVSRMAGHANYRVTLDMYVGTTAGVLDRARAATE